MSREVVVGTFTAVVLCAGLVWLIVWMTTFLLDDDDGRKVYASSSPADLPALRAAREKAESSRIDNLRGGYFSLAQSDAKKIQSISKAIAKHEHTLARKAKGNWWNKTPAPVTDAPTNDDNRTEWPFPTKK